MSATLADPTREVEKYAVTFRLPEARRYFATLANRLNDPDSGMASYLLTGADSQRIQVLLDALDEQLGPVDQRISHHKKS